jgi:hypothetical protein
MRNFFWHNNIRSIFLQLWKMRDKNCQLKKSGCACGDFLKFIIIWLLFFFFLKMLNLFLLSATSLRIQCKLFKCSIQCKLFKCLIQCKLFKCSIQCKLFKCSIQCKLFKCSIQCKLNYEINNNIFSYRMFVPAQFK